MQTLSKWLKWLSAQKTGSNISHMMLPMYAPGYEPIDYNNWLLTTEQWAPTPANPRKGYPEICSLLSYTDDASTSQNVFHGHRLAADFAAVISLALDRCIDIPYGHLGRVEGHGNVTFMPFGGIVDRVISGPIPKNSQESLGTVLSNISGLPDKDVEVIGAATSLLHGAILLHDRDIRSAYTLLICGIETLSRQYGEPPINWKEWDNSSAWEDFIKEQNLSTEQATGLRRRLMLDRQLRLKMTFRNYASMCLSSAFWATPWTEWLYILHAPAGRWGKPDVLFEGCVGDFLPSDRSALSMALGFSYDLRSSYLHRGKWFGPLELTFDSGSKLSLDQPLPFSILRAILRSLILTEIGDRTEGGTLPVIPLCRNWVPPSL